MSTAVFVIGAPGAGKSSVVDEVALRLELDGVSHGVLEVESFGRGLPWLPFEDCVAQLERVVETQRGAGWPLHLIVATPETTAELRLLVEATAATEALVVCLAASADVVAERLEAREPDRWPGKRDLVDRARRLAVEIPALAGIDVAVDSDDRTIAEAAGAIIAAMGDRGYLTTPATRE